MGAQMSSRVIGVIPARFASTRFPGKPLAKIKGKEMILWVLEGALTAKSLSEVIVVTDDARIEKVVTAAGGKAVMTDSDLPSGSDRIWAAVKSLPVDIIVNIQGDEPLVKGELVDQLVEPLLKDAKLEMSTLAHEISKEELSSPNSVKVVLDGKSNALYFSRLAMPGSLKHIGMYAYRKDFLKMYCDTPQIEIEKAESLEQLRALYLGATIRVVKVKEKSWGVDTPEDLAKIEQMLGGRS
jgi:3-deoxy-manno-octulosonate cytidylyltransferase (CMP-KDO synthetase)